MHPTTLTDAQIDARAKAHAFTHRVSYVEALSHVVAFAEEQATPTAAVVTSPAQRPLTDAQADVAAKQYAAQNGVDYLTALQIVLQSRGSAVEPDAERPVGKTDRQIDAAAHAYARAKGVSYSEALDCVTIQDAASFSEGAASVADADAVQTLQSQPIEIFRAGTQVDSAGDTRVFTLQDIQAMAASYNPARHEAPLTLGHPESDRPAYGWVKGLTATTDGRLLMMADKVEPAFAASVKASRYKKRSASFYPPLAPNNPAPGKWYLRHVGWLGAQPPAVQGLADVKFGTAADDGAVCFAWN